MRNSLVQNRSLVYGYDNPVLQYCEDIRTGNVVVPRKVKKVYFKLEQIILNPVGQWIYDENKANHAITFIEKYCKHSKGKFGGKSLLLETWQKALVAAMFGFIDKDTKLRKHTKTLLIIGRKNGKSTLSAAVGLYLQIADGEAGPEIYAISTKKDQSKIIWLEARRMAKKSPALKKKIKCLVGELVGELNDSFFKFLGSDSSTLDGLNVHGALADEIHAWKDQNLYDVVYDGMAAREQPMFFETTTAGTVRSGVFDTEYETASKCIDEIEGFEDDHLLPVIYELDNNKEWRDPAMHQKANPGLGTIKDRQKLLDKVKRAIANPALQKNLLCKEFDIRNTVGGAWLTFDEIDNTETFDIKDYRNCYAIGSADLSITTDLTCASILLMDKDTYKLKVLQMYFLPSDSFEKRVQVDRIPYDIWKDMGLLRLCEGNTINYSDVTQWFLEVVNDYQITPNWIYYDSYSARYWVNEMEAHGFVMVRCIQGAKTLSLPMQQLGADLQAKKINFNNSPILKWCLTNTAVETNRNGGIVPIKNQAAKQKIDGLAALLNSYVGLMDHLEEFQRML